jgi:hypothetical protein
MCGGPEALVDQHLNFRRCDGDRSVSQPECPVARFVAPETHRESLPIIVVIVLTCCCYGVFTNLAVTVRLLLMVRQPPESSVALLQELNAYPDRGVAVRHTFVRGA